MKQVENYKPRIREKCRVCKVYLAKGCVNDICLKCSQHACAHCGPECHIKEFCFTE